VFKATWMPPERSRTMSGATGGPISAFRRHVLRQNPVGREGVGVQPGRGRVEALELTGPQKANHSPFSRG
jgi:hypothetical protein